MAGRVGADAGGAGRQRGLQEQPTSVQSAHRTQPDVLTRVTQGACFTSVRIINRVFHGHLLDTVTLNIRLGCLRDSAALSVMLARGSSQPIGPHQLALRTFWVNLQNEQWQP